MKISFAVDMPQTEAHSWETQVAAALDHNGSNDENKDCGMDSLEHTRVLKEGRKAQG